MNRKFALSVAGYFLTTVATAYPWHRVLFHETYVQLGAMTRADTIVPLGMVAVVLQGVVFAYFYRLFYRHKRRGHPIARGLQFSLFLGLMVYTVMVFTTAAKFHIEPLTEFVALATVFQFLQLSVFGVVLGLVHGQLAISDSTVLGREQAL